MNPVYKRVVSVYKEHEDDLKAAADWAANKVAGYLRNPQHRDAVCDKITERLRDYYHIWFDDSDKDVNNLPKDQAHHH